MENLFEKETVALRKRVVEAHSGTKPQLNLIGSMPHSRKMLQDSVVDFTPRRTVPKSIGGNDTPCHIRYEQQSSAVSVAKEDPSLGNEQQQQQQGNEQQSMWSALSN
eukprot:1147533-Pelagomonas_calceolata.AAC.17